MQRFLVQKGGPGSGKRTSRPASVVRGEAVARGTGRAAELLAKAFLPLAVFII